MPSAWFDLRCLYVDDVGKVEIAPKWSVRGSIGVAEGRSDTSNGVVSGSPNPGTQLTWTLPPVSLALAWTVS